MPQNGGCQLNQKFFAINYISGRNAGEGPCFPPGSVEQNDRHCAVVLFSVFRSWKTVGKREGASLWAAPEARNPGRSKHYDDDN